MQRLKKILLLSALLVFSQSIAMAVDITVPVYQRADTVAELQLSSSDTFVDSIDVVVVGGAVGSNNFYRAKGKTKLSVDPVSATDPIAVGDNDRRMPLATDGRIVFAKKYSGADLGAKINAADADLGRDAGTIMVTGGGTITSRVTINDNHHLHFSLGTYILNNQEAQGKILIALGDNTTLSGEGDGTILQISSVSHAIVKADGGRFFGSNNGSNHDIQVRDLQFTSTQTSCSSALWTVNLVNTIHGVVDNVFFNGLHQGGVHAGGGSSERFFSDDTRVTNNRFKDMGFGGVAFVNSKNFVVSGNIWRGGGRPECGGGSYFFDGEVNTGTDILEGGSVTNNLVDAGGARRFPFGSAFIWQPNAKQGPITFSHNTVYGGSARISNCFLLSPNAKNVVINDNYCNGMGQYGIAARGTRLQIYGNTLIDTGLSSFAAIGMIGATDSEVHDNTITNPSSGLSRITESRGATGNRYRNNFLDHILGKPSFTILAGSVNDGWIKGTAIKRIVVVVYDPSLKPTSVAANTSAEQDFTVNGLTTADRVMVNGPRPTAGTTIGNVRVKSANTLSITFGNKTAGALTPAAGVYNIIVVRSNQILEKQTL